MTSHRLVLLPRLALALLGAAALLLTLVGPAAVAPADAAPKPPTATGLPAGIESMPSYVPAVSCTPTAKPGTVKLGKLLTKTYPGTTFYGSRVCSPLPSSEHHEGRAVDWMNSVRNAQQKAQAEAVISWLFATDARGNTYANVRRLGVMYVIWNNKIWGAYNPSGGWRPYGSCAKHPEKSWDNTCHRNHMHLSLSWEGAMGRTSYWTKKVAARDYGRCRPADLNWAYPYKSANPVPCPRYAKVKAPAGSSTLRKTLTDHSGKYLTQGSTGAAVTAVQKAMKMSSADGAYGPVTKAKVKKWQAAHGVKVTGTVNYATWRALLKATK